MVLSTTMKPFLGTWKFLRSDNFDEYLKGLGISYPLRAMAKLTSPTIQIGADASGKFNLKTDAVVRSVNAVFSLGHTFQETTVDFRSVSSVFSLDEEGALVSESTDNKSKICTTIKRRVTGDFMEVTMEVGEVKANAVFQRDAK